jgi:exodeoxyribonuclease VII small subunit
MKKSFESSLTELEKIVRQLEDGDLSLEESLKLFESGVTLTRECRERLDEAERRIEVLLKDSHGDPVIEEFDADDLRETPAIKRVVFEDEE